MMNLEDRIADLIKSILFGLTDAGMTNGKSQTIKSGNQKHFVLWLIYFLFTDIWAYDLSKTKKYSYSFFTNGFRGSYLKDKSFSEKNDFL